MSWCERGLIPQWTRPRFIVSEIRSNQSWQDATLEDATETQRRTLPIRLWIKAALLTLILANTQIFLCCEDQLVEQLWLGTDDCDPSSLDFDAISLPNTINNELWIIVHRITRSCAIAATGQMYHILVFLSETHKSEVKWSFNNLRCLYKVSLDVRT